MSFRPRSQTERRNLCPKGKNNKQMSVESAQEKQLPLYLQFYCIMHSFSF